MRQILRKKNQWIVHYKNTKRFSEQGTIQVKFKAGEVGLLPSIISKEMYFKSKSYWPKGRSTVSFKLGGVERKRIITSPLQEGEKATMLLRWRRYPLTREVLLIAEDGTELPLIADVRTPWEEMDASGSIKIMENKGVDVISASSIDDADTFSEMAGGLELPSKNKVKKN